MGLATASPEISVNVASVAFGWPDLGLGAALGSNVPALPLIITLSYLSARFPRSGGTGPADPPPPRVQPDAVPVQVVPYALVLLLLAALTIPPWWSGLQPVDGVILAGAFGLYLAYVFRQTRPEDSSPTPDCNIRRALIGLPAIALGALGSVIAARNLTDALGISDLIGGLFIIGFLCALPESFAAWKLTRERKTTTAVWRRCRWNRLADACPPPTSVRRSCGGKYVGLRHQSRLPAHRPRRLHDPEPSRSRAGTWPRPGLLLPFSVWRLRPGDDLRPQPIISPRR